jgi:DNA-binding HxlR family transcriptional regulator
MQRKSFNEMVCPIARTLEQVGEWWSMLIMRDALNGMTRFDEFQKNLPIAPNMLTRRLTSLVEAGLLERRQYSERPPRYEYIPTARGEDFREVLLILFAWGNKHCSLAGTQIHMTNAATNQIVEPIVVDRKTGVPLSGNAFKVMIEKCDNSGEKETVSKDLTKATKVESVPQKAAVKKKTARKQTT